jgi:PAS domain S-box-containing protein
VWRWWCLAVLLLIFWGVPADAIKTHPQVVIISSYHQGYEWSDKELAGILNSLHRVYPQMDPAIEYLDAKRFPGRDQGERMQIYLNGKYRGKKVDLVVALDNPALDLVIKYRQELFTGVPLVFGGINNFSPALLQGRQKVTGVAEVLDYAGTLDLALSLHHTAKEVLVIHDFTSTGLAEAQEMEKVARALKRRVMVNFTPPATFQEILEQLRSLPPGSIGLITGLATDRQGVSLGLAESTRLLATAAVPLYALHETRLGHGIVGGDLLEGHEHGRKVGELALKVLAGENPSQIPVVTKSTARPMFDYLQLKRFRIPLGDLPRGSVVINLPISFYSQNEKWIWGISAITVFLSLVIFILSVNIMRRRRAEQKQQESLNFLQILMDALPNPVFYKDVQGRYLGCNKACEEAWGISREDLIGKTVFDQHPRDLADIYYARDAELLSNPGVQVYETSIAHAPGTRKNVILHKATFSHLDGTLAGIIGVEVDITARKRAEQEVKNLAKFPEENPNPVLRVSPEGIILYANQASKALLGQWGWEVGQPLPGDWRDRILKSLEAACGQEMELTYDGRAYLLTLAPIVDMGYLNIYGVDITARKRAEKRILASLKEKEVLLKEIHHRVKNNLQIISTLLSLQIKHRGTQDLAELFQECQNRIRSMALIHESLYNTEDLASINFRDYLAKLSTRLMAAYGSMARGIKISLDGKDVHLDISQAVPCGLIANELLVNALKHAFPGRDAGEIQISIEDTGGRRVLEVRDNGVGLGSDLVLENPTTFGWMMVKNLAKQVGGGLTVRSNGGTSFRIVF